MSGITECDRILLQIASGITKCDRLYSKVHQVLQSMAVITKLDVTTKTTISLNSFDGLLRGGTKAKQNFFLNTYSVFDIFFQGILCFKKIEINR